MASPSRRPALKLSGSPPLKAPPGNQTAKKLIGVSYNCEEPINLRLSFDLGRRKVNYVLISSLSNQPLKVTFQYELFQTIMVGLVIGYNRVTQDNEKNQLSTIPSCIEDMILKYHESTKQRLFSRSDDMLQFFISVIHDIFLSTLVSAQNGDLFPYDEPMRSRRVLEKLVENFNMEPCDTGVDKGPMSRAMKQAWDEALKEYKDPMEFAFALRIMAKIHAKTRGGPQHRYHLKKRSIWT